MTPRQKAVKVFSLVAAKRRLKRIQARRRWRNAINAVRAMGKMTSLVSSHQVDYKSENEILRKIIRDRLGPHFNIDKEIKNYK